MTLPKAAGLQRGASYAERFREGQDPPLQNMICKTVPMDGKSNDMILLHDTRIVPRHCREKKNAQYRTMRRYRAGMGSNDDWPAMHALSAGTPRKMQKPRVITHGSCKKKRGKEKWKIES